MFQRAILLVMIVSSASATAEDYYSGIDTALTDGDLKIVLQTLISNRTVIPYGDAWAAFEVIDQYLPTAPSS